MSTFYSVTKFADAFKSDFPKESSLSIFFSINDATTFSGKFGEQISFSPFYIVSDTIKLNHTAIQERFATEENNTVKITFNPSEKKQLNKRASFMKLSINISKKQTMKQRNGQNISYYSWSLTRYENENLAQAYESFIAPIQEDESVEELAFD